MAQKDYKILPEELLTGYLTEQDTCSVLLY